MLDLTAHMMLRNESFWIGYVLAAACRVLDKIIVIDCGSEDATPDIVRHVQKYYPETIHFETTGPLTEAENGAIRQYMTDNTKTEWAAIIDGDELYSVEALWNILNTGMPKWARLGFGLLKVVDFVDGQFVIREQFNRQLLFHAPSTKWKGVFPFDAPNWYDVPASFYYLTNVQGWDLAHLPRSPLDAVTRHRHSNDGIRQTTPITGVLPEMLPLLEEIAATVPLPSNPVLDQIYAAQVAY